MSDLEEKKQLGDVCICGLGKTGDYLAHYLARLQGSCVRSVTLYPGANSQESPQIAELRACGVNCVLGSEKVEGNFDLCIVSPGISEFSDFFQSAKAASVELIGEPEFAWRQSPTNWIAITGTNGKTTTTTLTTDILNYSAQRAVAVGNIGYLASSAVEKRKPGQWFVAELSSFQLACTSELHPRVAILLNITPDHIEWHKTLENYAHAKERIFANLTKTDLAIISTADSFSKDISERLFKRGLRVCILDPEKDPGTKNAAFLHEGRLVVRQDGCQTLLCTKNELTLKGTHNVENALAAAAASLEIGISKEDVCACLQSEKPLEHRIEPCGSIHGISFVNDSKATNTDSCKQALTAFDLGSIVLLLGGHDKGTDLSELSAAALKSCAAIICYGEAGPRFYTALKKGASDKSVLLFQEKNLASAFECAVKHACSGQSILFSPACSSFDEFSGFEERGRVFKDMVQQYINDVQSGAR